MEAKQEWDYSAPPLQAPYVWSDPTNLRDPSEVTTGSSSSIGGTGDALGFRDDQQQQAPFIYSTGVPLTGGNEHVMRALQMQTAFVNGDPSSNEELELYYYRLVRVFRS